MDRCYVFAHTNLLGGRVKELRIEGLLEEARKEKMVE